MPCEGGWWVSAQLALVGGRGRGGLVHPKILITCLGSQGTLCPCSLLMIRVGRSWNLLLLLMGPGPFSLMHSARSNKSSSEGDTSFYSLSISILLIVKLVSLIQLLSMWWFFKIIAESSRPGCSVMWQTLGISWLPGASAWAPKPAWIGSTI